GRLNRRQPLTISFVTRTAQSAARHKRGRQVDALSGRTRTVSVFENLNTTSHSDEAMPREELPEPLDVIAVGAHPDDVEIACGGTLAKLVRQGYRVGIVDLTDGEPTPLSPGPEARLAEATEAAKILGVHVR